MLTMTTRRREKSVVCLALILAACTGFTQNCEGVGGRFLEDNSLSGTLPAPWARLGVLESPDSSTRPADDVDDDEVDLDDDDDDDDD